MALSISSLNSGSNGNCYYIGNSKEAVLVDAGISCRELEKRMLRSGLCMDKVKALFISHEHHDHIRGVEVLSRKYKLPVYLTKAIYENGHLNLDRALLKVYKAYVPVAVGDLLVLPFPKRHDASDPHSFTIEHKGVRVGVLTDIGSPCEHVIDNFRKCHAAFLESNYDEEMLESGSYPYYLKRRIRGDRGHLSNVQALELFISHKPEFMSHVFLSHLSKDNNSPELVLELFRKHAGNTRIDVASRDTETGVFHISDKLSRQLRPAIEEAQATLF